LVSSGSRSTAAIVSLEIVGEGVSLRSSHYSSVQSICSFRVRSVLLRRHDEAEASHSSICNLRIKNSAAVNQSYQEELLLIIRARRTGRSREFTGGEDKQPISFSDGPLACNHSLGYSCTVFSITVVIPRVKIHRRSKANLRAIFQISSYCIRLVPHEYKSTMEVVFR
jgi:hypothetical protein